MVSTIRTRSRLAGSQVTALQSDCGSAIDVQPRQPDGDGGLSTGLLLGVGAIGLAFLVSRGRGGNGGMR